MSDAQVNTMENVGVVHGTSMTAGALLRSAREAQGLHIAALAVAMKVPVKKLEALEADRLDQTSDAVFVRALASGVCRALKIDSAPILEKLPPSPVPRLGREERVVNTPFTVPTASRSWTLAEILKKPAVMGVVVLVVGAGVLLLLPDNMSFTDKTDQAQAPVVREATVPTAEIPTPVVATAPLPLPEANQAATSEKPVPVQSGLEVAGSTSGLVAFQVRGSSWVEVTDAKGVVQLRKTLHAGDKVAASGELPLSVIIGRADVTEVEVRGKPFALDAVVKDNVARFEVK